MSYGSYSTRCVHEDGRESDIQVEVTPAAREAIGKLEEVNAEAMIKRCVWRFIGLRHEANEVLVGLNLFSIGQREILRLYRELKEIDSEQKGNREG